MSGNILKHRKMRERRHSNWASDGQMDAVILAGMHKNPKRMVFDQNKALLNLREKPLIYYVVNACLKVKRLNRVVVVGPRNELEIALADLMGSHGSRLKIIQQRSRLLENVWNGFLATFDDGNNLPINIGIKNLLLGGHIPIRKKAHLHLIKAVYAAVAGQMQKTDKNYLHRGAVLAIMERRFDEFRARFERQEWFMGKMGVEILLANGHVLQEEKDGVVFREPYLQDYFSEWEDRFQKYIFVTGSDLPLLIPEAIDDYIQRCNRVPGDFFIGVASAEILEQFYHCSDGSKGFFRPYLAFREAEVRAANLIIVCPNRVGNKELIQESFGVRKMTKWRNVIAAIWKLLRLSGRFQTVKMTALLQISAVLKKYNWIRTSQQIQRFIRVKEFEQLLSRIFMTQLILIESPYGGASLDVDDEEDFKRLSQDYEYWLSLQDQIVEKATALPENDYQRIGCFKDMKSDLTGESNLDKSP